MLLTQSLLRLYGVWDIVLLCDCTEKCDMDKKRIVYEDDKIIIYNKPSGVLVQSNRSFDVDLMSDIKTYLVRKGEKSNLFIINRLDRPVSGLVLMAKTKEMAAFLSKILQKGNIDKEYLAVIKGKVDAAEGTMEDYLVTDPLNNTSSISNSKDVKAKRAALEYEVIASREISNEVLSLVKIKLLTGRHHQIRVQFASRNTPLMGDTKYGMEDNSVKTGGLNKMGGISLCSYKLEFDGKSFSIIPSGNGFEYFKDELGKLS